MSDLDYCDLDGARRRSAQSRRPADSGVGREAQREVVDALGRRVEDGRGAAQPLSGDVGVLAAYRPGMKLAGVPVEGQDGSTGVVLDLVPLSLHQHRTAAPRHRDAGLYDSLE